MCVTQRERERGREWGPEKGRERNRMRELCFCSVTNVSLGTGVDAEGATVTFFSPSPSLAPCALVQGDTVTPAVFVSLQQAETAGCPHEEASPSLWRPARWVPTSAHPAPVRVHLALLPPPGQQPEDVSEDREVEWACPVLHP